MSIAGFVLLSVSLCLSVCLSQGLSFYLSLCVCMYVYRSIPISFSHSISNFLTPAIFVIIFIVIPLFLSLYVSLSRRLFIFISLFLPLSHSISSFLQFSNLHPMSSLLLCYLINDLFYNFPHFPISQSLEQQPKIVRVSPNQIRICGWSKHTDPNNTVNSRNPCLTPHDVLKIFR